MNNNLRIVADENIPLVKEVFSAFGEVLTLPGRSIVKGDVESADILIVRSVTKVNAELLENTKVRFVGTCTIGTDHVDLKFLQEHEIAFASAPGCNAMGVVQYVICTLALAGIFRNFDADADAPKPDIGIIGCGNVGSKVHAVLRSLSFPCKVYDPFLNRSEVSDWVPSLNDLSHCSVVTTHTPLTVDGEYPTKSMLDDKFFAMLSDETIFINAGRGEAVNESALLSGGHPERIKLCLDVWENEPRINQALVARVFLGSPHIAGYSYEGKLNGTQMIAVALQQFLGKNVVDESVFSTAKGEREAIVYRGITETLLAVYDPRRDFEALKAIFSDKKITFDGLRKNYPQRREFSHFKISDVPDGEKPFFAALGFGFTE